MNKRCAWGYVFVCLLVLLIAAPSAWAESLDPTADTALVATVHPVGVPSVDPSMIATDVEALLDRVIHNQMENGALAGATVAVVANGDVIIRKGYGLADVGRGIAVDPERTLFRVGSISKLFVWTAVMQLVENGQLDLNTDVNEYVDFEIPNRLYARAGSSAVAPITLTHLMTHSAGFEDVPEDLFHLHAGHTIPLAEYVSTHIPARVFPAGELSAYSNYGSALAGYIVERISGMPFEQYVEKYIFTPLRMNSSTFRQPVEPTLLSDVAKGYGFVNGQLLEGDFIYALGPAGGMSSPAADMARFMLAHLHGGTLDGERILANGTVRRMHSPLFAQHPALDGMAHGFLEQSVNGQRVLYHMGSVVVFNSGMYLLPDAGVGLFVAYNGGSHLEPMELFREFMNAFYPGAGAGTVAAPGALASPIATDTDAGMSTTSRGARAFVGEYHMNRRSVTTNASLLSLLETLRVDVDDDGKMRVTHLGQTDKFVEVEPGMFRNVAPDNSVYPYGAFETIVFQEGSGGRTVLLSDGPMSYTKVPWYATSVFTLSAVFITVLALLGTGAIWLAQVIINRVRRRVARDSVSPDSAGITVARAVAATFALVTTGFLVGVLTATGDMEPAYGIPKAFFGIEPGWAAILNVFPVPMVVLGGAMTVCSIVVWRRKLWGVGGRIHYTLVTACALVLLAVLRGWHVI